MKIYTKTGDNGETSLLGGKRVGKCCIEMQVIGEIDELNAALGLIVVSLCATNCHPERAPKGDEGSLSVNPPYESFLLGIDPSSATASLGMTNRLIDFLQSIQRDLFKIGAELAGLQIVLSPSAREGEGGVKINNDRVMEMEKMIDEFWSELPELKNFILPGGSEAAAFLHLARTVCRRAERQLVEFAKKTSIRPELNMYFNRLSDFLFAAARWVNFKSGEEEIKV